MTTTIKHYNVPTVTLTFSNGDQVATTGVHPFYVQDKGFVPASDLAIGNAIVTRAGPAVTVTKIEQTAPETVYNITVDGDHTYFVGSKDGGVWVHNTNPLTCPSNPPGTPVPTPRFIVAPNGTTIEIPIGYVGRVTNSGKEIIFQDPAYVGVNNSNSIRIMDPTAPGGASGKSPGYPNGYAVITNKYNQPVNIAGKPAGGKGATHLPF